jgi:hypothetical protein
LGKTEGFETSITVAENVWVRFMEVGNAGSNGLITSLSSVMPWASSSRASHPRTGSTLLAIIMTQIGEEMKLLPSDAFLKAPA